MVTGYIDTMATTLNILAVSCQNNVDFRGYLLLTQQPCFYVNQIRLKILDLSCHGKVSILYVLHTMHVRVTTT